MSCAIVGSAALLCAAPPVSAQCEVNELSKLTASNAAAGDRFGHAVGHASPWTVVGAPDRTNANGSSAGSAYIFLGDDGGTPDDPVDDTWTEHQIILPSLGSADDDYGWSVGTDGNRVIVGAPEEDENGRVYGAAYIFRRDDAGTPGDPSDDTWSEEARLEASDRANNDRFGFAVSIRGDWAAVGAENGDGVAANTGAVYMYRRGDNGSPFDPTDDVWIQHVKLAPTDLAAGNGFGSAVQVTNGRLIVGAPRRGNRGAAYFFWHRTNATLQDLTDDGWEDQDTVTAADSAIGDDIGAAVAIGDEVAIVGAPLHAGAGADSGAAFMFSWNDNGTAGNQDDDTWPQEQELVGTDTAADDRLGGGVAMHGTDAVSGAPQDDDLGASSGAAFLYRHDGGAWSEEAKMLASDGAADGEFGGATTMGATRVMIGAAGDAEGGADAGAVYVFDGTVITDCNDNGLCDATEISGDPSMDMDGNGIPDVCETPPCPADLDGNGSVGFSDLNDLLGDWGPCPGCPADLDGNGTVGFSDLNTLLGAWGSCT